MTIVSFSNNCDSFAINHLYLSYKNNPASAEAFEAFNEALGNLAYQIAPEYPTRFDALGNLTDIYCLMLDYAKSSVSADYLADVIKLVDKEFGKHSK